MIDIATSGVGRDLASPTGFEATDPLKPTSEPVDQTRKDNDLPDEPDDGSGR